jgi:HK97 family phage prohead protease
MKNLMMVCEAALVVEKHGSTGNIEATVTTWGAREGADGRRFNYQPEGFMDWANEFAKTGKPLPMFLNHQSDNIPIGQWTSFEFTPECMTAQGRIYTNTTAGKDVYTVMQESPSMFGGVSVGAYADEYQMVNADGEPDQGEEAYFQITKGGLREVSVVMYPNNPQANVNKLECFTPDGQIDLRQLEQHLRDSGVSKQNAVTAASVFKEILERRDSAKEPLETAPTRRDSDAEVTEILAALEQRELLKILDTRLKG